MTIDEAIKQLTLWAQHPPGVVFSSELPAVKLGIEALKRILVWRGGATIPKDYPLQGETKD